MLKLLFNKRLKAYKYWILFFSCFILYLYYFDSSILFCSTCIGCKFFSSLSCLLCALSFSTVSVFIVAFPISRGENKVSLDMVLK